MRPLGRETDSTIAGSSAARVWLVIDFRGSGS